jgi:hypothetical protein
VRDNYLACGRHGHERATARAMPSFPFVFCDVFCVIAFCMPPPGCTPTPCPGPAPGQDASMFSAPQ